MTAELTVDEWREATTYDLIDWHRTFSTEEERDAAWAAFLARVRRDAAASCPNCRGEQAEWVHN